MVNELMNLRALMKRLLLTVVGTCFILLVFSQNELPHALLVGDKAPVLPLDKWIKGHSINTYDTGKVYLIDFWAVWCGPCIAGMPHLSDLQKKYKSQGLQVMSVTSEDEWGNSYDKVIAFLQTKGQAFEYSFAWLPESYRSDHKYKSIIYNPWLIAAYDSAIWALPQVFLIDRSGKIAFIGDGYSLTEDYLAKVLNNSHNLQEERKKYIATANIEKETSFFLQLLETKNLAEAKRKGREICNDSNVSPHALLVISDNVFNKYQDYNDKDLFNIGLEAAKKGAALTDWKSPSQLATLAKGYSLTNDPQRAVATIKTAILLADSDFKDTLQKDLVRYENQLKQ